MKTAAARPMIGRVNSHTMMMSHSSNEDKTPSEIWSPNDLATVGPDMGELSDALLIATADVVAMKLVR
jgi:hypothetical protein